MQEDICNEVAAGGFIMFPHEMCEKLCRTKISGYDRRVFDCILRKTLGWQKDYDYISISQFQKMTNIHPPNVVRSLRRLESRNIILVERGDRGGKLYTVNLQYNEWID